MLDFDIIQMQIPSASQVLQEIVANGGFDQYVRSQDHLKAKYDLAKVAGAIASVNVEASAWSEYEFAISRWVLNMCSGCIWLMWALMSYCF